MRWSWHLLLAVVAAGGQVVGCSGPNAQISRCQSEKQELLAVIEQEKSRTQAYQERALALEARLDQSEKQLAQLAHPGSRFARQDSKPASEPSARLEPRTASSATEPVREPGTARLREMKLQAPGTGAPVSEGGLAALVQRDSRLEFDSSTGMARFTIDLPFDPNRAELTEKGRQRLDEVAAWLKSPQASELRVLVCGRSSGMRKPPAGAQSPRYDNDRQLGIARAMAVADYLDRRGIPEERLAVVGSGSKRDSEGTDGVEILLADPGTPVAGMSPAAAIRR